MKKPLLIVAKIVISTSLIAWILQKSDLATIWDTIKQANFALILAAFVLFYVGYLIIAKRQHTLLKAQNIQVTIPFLLQSFAIGMFFSNLLPSTIGGDASRMYDVWRVGGSKSKAVSVILIDRFFGMFALMIYGLIAAILSTGVRQAVPGIVVYMALGVLAMLTILWVVFGSGARLIDWFQNLHLGPFGFIQRVANKIIAGFELFKGRGDVLIKATAWSFLLQFNVIMHFVLVAMALDIEVPIHAMFIIIPLATLLMLLPLSINGIGIRETAFVFLFGIYGVSVESAVAFAWVALAMLMVQGVVGGIVFLLRRSLKANPADT
ncbi:MAG: lysylphosphatidylglycerol synthase transmembrane domain-containing protein [Gammaproteobacteria bacterium]